MGSGPSSVFRGDGRNIEQRHSSNIAFDIGDTVKVNVDADVTREGFIVERLSDNKVRVDCGELIVNALTDNCTLIAKATDFEVGDKVSARTDDSFLYYVGKVLKVDKENKTIDVLMDGDTDDDIEYDIKFENARILMRRRALVQSRWRRAFMVVQAARRFVRAFNDKEEVSA